MAAADHFEILPSAVKAGQNIVGGLLRSPKASRFFQLGKLLRAIEIGLLAEVGRSAVATIPRLALPC